MFKRLKIYSGEHLHSTIQNKKVCLGNVVKISKIKEYIWMTILNPHNNTEKKQVQRISSKDPKENIIFGRTSQ